MALYPKKDGKMTEVEQRIAKDVKQASLTYPDAIGIILSNGKEWGNQMSLIRSGKFKEAMTSIESSIAEIEGYLSDSPGAKDILSFTLARAYENKGWCMVMQAGAQQPPNNPLARQGIQWVDKAFATANYPPDYGRQQREMRATVANTIAQKERESQKSSSRNNPSRINATPNTQSFSQVRVICPRCGQTSILDMEGNCSGGCKYDMDLFQSGGGLVCVKCGIGYYANPDGKGRGVLRCTYRGLTGGNTEKGFSYSAICHAPIPATPEFVTPKPNCFIATATYGNPLAPEIEILREFRERYLRTTTLGKAFIVIYENSSPPFANWLSNRPLARAIIRRCFLSPVIWLIKQQWHAPK